MRAVFGLVLIVGVALAGGAVYMARNYISEYQAQLARERQAAQEALANAKVDVVPTVEVVVSNRTLKYGEPLTKEDVRLVEWPETAVPEGSFTDMTILFPEIANGDRFVLRTMEKDEALMEVKVTKPGEDAGVSARLSPGMRAFAIRTDVTSGVSGFLRPGDRVDVYWTGPILPGQNGTRLIETNVRLVAINQSADEDRNGPIVARTVTVEVNPRQVASLAQAQSSGRLSLSLVGADDQIVSEEVEIDQNQFLGIQQVERKKQERKCFVKKRVNGELVDTPVRTECTN